MYFGPIMAKECEKFIRSSTAGKNKTCLVWSCFIKLQYKILKKNNTSLHKVKDYVRKGGEGAFPPEFEDSEKRTQKETDNLLLIAS